jgi:hypothetical protein
MNTICFLVAVSNAGHAFPGSAKGASTLLVLVLQRLGVTVVGVYRQLYRHCSEPLEHMAPVDRAAWDRAREIIHICGKKHETEQSGRTSSLIENRSGGCRFEFSQEFDFLTEIFRGSVYSRQMIEITNDVTISLTINNSSLLL